MTTPERFSLLLPVYGGDRPQFLREAFASAIDEQSRRPNQVILVRDGPVPGELTRCLDELTAASPVPVTRVDLEHNGGLGAALDRGLAASHYDVVARMDADDVCLPHRFAAQLPLIEAGADVAGAGLLEFERDTGTIAGRRIPPCDPAEIAARARFHDPLNHPTIVYRCSAVRAAGGYRHFPLMEDYWLFARMIAGGARVVNTAEPLVYYRVGAGAYARRGGYALLRSELRLQRQLRREGFTSRAQFLRNVLIRGGYRIAPERIRRAAYRRLIAPYGERGRRPADPAPEPTPSLEWEGTATSPVSASRSGPDPEAAHGR